MPGAGPVPGHQYGHHQLLAEERGVLQFFTILYNFVLGKPGLPLARVAGLTLIYTYTKQKLLYSIIASVCFCFSPHYYFLWLLSGITVKREREVSSPDNTSSVPSLHLKLSYSCIWHKCVDLKEWNLDVCKNIS